MAQYDGAIRIVTKITTKDATESLSSLEYQIKKSAKYIDELRRKMDALKDQKIPTKEYKDLQDELSKAETALSELIAKQEEWTELGISSGLAWDELNEKVAAASEKVDSIKGKMQALTDAGKDFTFGKDTAEYKSYAQQIQYEEEAIVKAGKHYDKLLGKTKERLKEFAESARKTFSRLSVMTGKVSSGIEKIGVFAKNAFSGLHKSVKKSNGMLATMRSRFKGLALSLLIFNQISKAFNAMTASIRDGYTNLYNDNEKFKRSVDSIKASALTLKNSLAAAFRPLVDIAIPYIQKVMDFMSGLLNSVGQFLAAITGQRTYTKAIKQTTAALKEGKKAVEGYLSPLDEINKYQTNKASDTNTGAGGIMFQEAPIADRFKKLAQQVKDIFSQIFKPFKEAWKREGKFVMDAWKSAIKEIGNLAKSIGSDFLEVWQQGKTVKILEDIFHIVGDIGLAVSGIAHNFRLAWEEGKTGKRILEGIRDIVGVITANIRHAADVTVEWARELDFSPLLNKVQGLVESLVPVFDSLSGIVTDFYEKVLLPLGKWTLEKGLPDLLQVFIDFNNKVDWDALRSRLAQFWEHLEPFAETVGEGLIIFIERCANALADFVNSPAFDSFLTAIENWMDNVKPEDVADSLESLAKSIIVLKTAALGFSVASKAISIFEKAIKVFEKLGSVVAFLKGIKIVPFLTSLFSAMNPGMIGELGLSLGRLLEGTFLDTSTWEGLPKKLHDAVTNAIDAVGSALSEAATRVGEAVKRFLNGVFNWDATKSIFEEAKENFKKGGVHIIEGIIDGILGGIGFIVEPIGDLFTTFWDALCDVFGIHSPAATMLPIGENIILGLLNGILDAFSDIGTWIKEHIFDPFIEGFKSVFGIHSPSTVMEEQGSYITRGLLNGITSLFKDVKTIWDPIKSAWTSAWEGMRNSLGNIVKGIKRTIGVFFNWISDKVDDIKESLSSIGKRSSITGGAGSRFLSSSFSTGRTFSYSPSIPYASPAFAALAEAPIPKLATGAVIPANREFLAVLGDQKHGTNIEAPLETIEQANERLLMKVLSRLGIDGNPGGGATYKFVAQLNGRTLFEETINQGKVRQMSTGRNPFAFE